jgi:hypothetical protein
MLTSFKQIKEDEKVSFLFIVPKNGPTAKKALRIFCKGTKKLIYITTQNMENVCFHVTKSTFYFIKNVLAYK